MSRYWKPEIATREWRMAVVVLGGAAAVGLGAAYVLSPRADDSNGKSDSPIEWNAVQAVPKRVLSPDEVAWEKRGVDPSPVIASPEGARQSSVTQPAEEEAGLPRGSAARNDPLLGATGRLYVIDGDTFGIGGQHIRIADIDAPETHPSRCLDEARLGLAATAKLRELLGSGAVTMSGSGRDQYGRELRTVQVDGQDVGETMIAAGLARSYAGGKKQGWC